MGAIIFGAMSPRPPSDGCTKWTQAELVQCESCGRRNAPTRTRCLYCGAALPAKDVVLTGGRIVARSLEEWERGFNVCALPNRPPSAAQLPRLAEWLDVETDLLRDALAMQCALPLARVATEEQARSVQTMMREANLTTSIIADEELNGDAPLRLRRLAFLDERLAAWTVLDERITANWEELRLIVRGRIRTHRLEVEERGGRGAETREIIEARDFTSDYLVIDLFGFGPRPWRVVAHGFDFSCLGERRSLLAEENSNALIEEIARRANRAVCDDLYEKARRWLDIVWPPAARTESAGVRRAGLGRIHTAMTTLVSNERQFARYGSLQLKALNLVMGGVA
ncbi:MAG: hypothetical protein C4334_03240 [Pyrinomonas sp.]